MKRLAKRWTAASILGCLAAAAIASGCNRGPLSPDEEVRLLVATNRDLEQKLLASEQRVADLTASGAVAKPVPPAPEDPYRPVAVRFGRFTGGIGPGGAPGDERLKVVLEPVDAEGDLVKQAGSLVLEAFEPAGKDQPPKPYHRWEFPLEDLAKTWIDMFGVRGYVLKLAWPAGRKPAADALLLRAKFTTLSGEVLTAETEARVGPPKPAPAPAK